MASKLRIAGGYVFIGLGIIGLMLPVVPQVPFFIAGVALLGKDHKLVRGGKAWLRKKGIMWGGDEPPEPPPVKDPPLP